MEAEELKLNKLIVDATKTSGLTAIVTWDYKSGIDFPSRKKHIQTIKRAINWLFMNIQSISTGDKLMLICHKDIYDNIISEIDIFKDNKIGTISVFINNDLPDGKVILTKTPEPKTLDEFGILEVLMFKKEISKKIEPNELLTSIQELLSELRIDERCLGAMSEGYSPEHIDRDINWKNPHCKVQLSQRVAKKLYKILKK